MSETFHDSIDIIESLHTQTKKQVTLKTFNMSHGDCYIFESEKETLMIDCGNYGNKKHNINNIIPLINSPLLSEKRNHLVITHMHADHMNRIDYLDPEIVFDDVYLSNLVSLSDIMILFITLKFPSSSIIYRKAYNYLMMIPKISAHLTKNSRIHFVSKGSYLNTSSIGSFEVLWPDISSARDINKIRSLFSSQEIEIVNSYYENISRMHDYDEANTLRIEEESQAVYLAPALESSVKEFISINKESKIEFGDDILFLKIISQTANYTSLVFHEKEKCLFCSDITSSIFKNYVSANIAASYRFLKTPHHGTSNSKHFNKVLPKCYYALINEDICKSPCSPNINITGYSKISNMLVIFDVTGSALSSSTIIYVDKSHTFPY